MTGGTGGAVEELNSLDLLEQRQTQKVLQGFMANIDVPNSDSDYDIRFRKFIEVVNMFYEKGRLFPQPSDLTEKMKKTKAFGSYPEFESWLLTPAVRSLDLNFFHKAWGNDHKLRNKLTLMEKEHLDSWMSIFLEFERFLILRPKVNAFHLRTEKVF